MSLEAAVALHIDPAALTPLVRQIVSETIAQLEAARAQIPDAGQLAYSEEQAAALLALEPHVLRDERRRGRISASSVVGRRVRYSRQDLIDYLASRRIAAKGQ